MKDKREVQKKKVKICNCLNFMRTECFFGIKRFRQNLSSKILRFTSVRNPRINTTEITTKTVTAVTAVMAVTAVTATEHQHNRQ